MRNLKPLAILIILSQCILACSDSDSLANNGGNSGGIGGTGAAARGTIDTIDSNGNIYVNGIRYGLEGADITVDGNNNAAETDLRLGMVVLISGEIDQVNTGSAQSVTYDDEIQGPITNIRNFGEEEKRLTILDTTVVVNEITTFFDGITFDGLTELAVLEVSGYYSDDRLIATRLEYKGDFIANDSEIELKGLVTNVQASSFVMGNFTVNFDTATLIGPDGFTLENNLNVAIRGTLVGSTITASTVAVEQPLFATIEDNSLISLEGIVSHYVSDSDFSLLDISVNAGNPNVSREPADIEISDGAFIAVEGIYDGDTLIASTIESQQGQAKMKARVVAVNGNEIELDFLQNRSLTLTVNSQTVIQARNGSPLSVSDIFINSYLIVDATVSTDTMNNQAIIAKQVTVRPMDDTILLAPLEDFTPDVSVTLLGLTFSIDSNSAEFFSVDDDSIPEETSAEFYSNVTLGDKVMVLDNGPANGSIDIIKREAR